MSSHSYDNLAGVKFFATIGEPWNFESKSGVGRLFGVIKSVITTFKNIPIIRCEVDEFKINAIFFHEVFAVNRYKTSQDLMQTFMSGKRAGVNLCFFSGSLNLGDDMAMPIIFGATHVDFLVGSMKILFE